MTLLNGTMTPIQTVTVGAGGASSIDFTNIPQTYTDLLIKISARTNRNATDGDDLKVTVNDSTSAIYNNIRLYGNGTGTGSDKLSNSNPVYIGMATAASQTASTFGSTEFYFPNYTSSNNKSMSSDGVSENNATNVLTTLGAWLWASTSAITKIVIAPYNGTSFAQYSTATLYGVTSAGYGAKATGGTISSDANYYYHTFTTSGTFTPTQSITAECIVVAGGGGGGSRRGGGGGAGGFIYVGGQGLSAQNYTVTIGAGGTGGLQSDPWYGTNGSNSSISGITTATGGGYGRGDGRGDGASGGSGGGGSSGNGGSPVSNQGNSGGSGSNSAPNYGGGGGGGAGSAGQNGTSTTGGNGGAGTSTYSSWGIGQDINGTYWLAGGGGGGTYNGGVAGNGGAGGGGNASIANSDATASSGLPNTGGGGGGNSITVAGNTGNGGVGGSGIVIIRYPK